MIDAARERRGAQKVRVRRRRDRVIADFAALVGIGEHRGAQMAGEHLRAEADAEQRLVLAERHGEPVDLAPDPVEVVVVGAHRSAEDDRAGVLGERRRQRLAEARAANVEREAALRQQRADAPRRRVVLVQDDQHFVAPVALKHHAAPLRRNPLRRLRIAPIMKQVPRRLVNAPRARAPAPAGGRSVPQTVRRTMPEAAYGFPNRRRLRVALRRRPCLLTLSPAKAPRRIFPDRISEKLRFERHAWPTAIRPRR